MKFLKSFVRWWFAKELETKEEQQLPTSSEIKHLLEALAPEISSSGSFVDEVIVSSMNNKEVIKHFEKYPAQTLKQKRRMICQLLLHISSRGGSVEVALLSKEIVAPYRRAIERLPDEYQEFYQVEHSVKDLARLPLLIPSIENGVLSLYVIPKSKKDIEELEEQYQRWHTVYFHPWEPGFHSAIRGCANDFADGLCIFRFYKTASSGGGSTKGKKFGTTPVFTPSLNPI